jgi:hypothetical protein
MGRTRIPEGASLVPTLGQSMQQAKALEQEQRLEIQKIQSQRELERQHTIRYMLENVKASIIQTVTQNQTPGPISLPDEFVDPSCPEFPVRFECHRDHAFWKAFVEWAESEELGIQHMGWSFEVKPL